MKKVLLTAIALLTIASASVFGMYGKGDSWMDFLTHGNQLRARMDQLGFVLGNGTIKGTFGFRANRGYLGSILAATNNTVDFRPTVSAGIGYTSEMIGVGVGYNYTYIDKNLQVHTPVLTLNALNNSIRFIAPIQVAVSDKINVSAGGGNLNVKYTGVAFNNIQFRYYTGIDAFNAIRLYAFYRNSTIEAGNNKGVSEAFGIQARFYFLRTQVGDVTVNPYIRVEYHTALKGSVSENYDAESYPTIIDNVNYLGGDAKQSDIYDVSPYRVYVKPVLSLALANSEFVNLYLEPYLGYTLTGSKRAGAAEQTMTHALAWGAYTELYVTPIKDLEWYFEMDINGNAGKNATVAGLNPVSFATSTGLTWYLPSLQ